MGTCGRLLTDFHQMKCSSCYTVDAHGHDDRVRPWTYKRRIAYARMHARGHNARVDISVDTLTAIQLQPRWLFSRPTQSLPSRMTGHPAGGRWSGSMPHGIDWLGQRPRLRLGLRRGYDRVEWSVDAHGHHVRGHNRADKILMIRSTKEMLVGN